MIEMTKAQIQNSLECAIENLDTTRDGTAQITSVPFDDLYAENGISITVNVEGSRFQIAVGYEGSADVVAEANLPISQADITRTATAVLAEINAINEMYA